MLAPSLSPASRMGHFRSAGPSRPAPALPAVRGPLTYQLFGALTDRGRPLAVPADVSSDPLADDDLQLALYCCYELHYRGLPGVEEGWEWEPSLIAFCRTLEAAFESQLRAAIPRSQVLPADAGEALWSLTRNDEGPSLSGWLRDNGTLAHARELAIHRSGYQLKEADPHSWAIPRLGGRAKAALISIQSDEYGNGREKEMHASLFAQTMDALNLNSHYGHYLDCLPAPTLATTNLITMLGLHRRLRGALVGHLALFEMTSVGPMSRYSDWLESLGVPAAGRAFYDVHVEADVVHQHIAVDDLVGGLLQAEPALADDVMFGAQALSLVESRFTESLLTCWQNQRTSLLQPTCERAIPYLVAGGGR
jgi:hypothetical protein